MIKNDLFQAGRMLFKEFNAEKLAGYVNDLLLQIIENNYLYDKTYFHPLGFIYSELIEFENRDTLRFNIWDDVRLYQEPRMEIHNHFYEFHSLVLKGKLTNSVYKIVDNETSAYAEYIGRYDKQNGRTLQKTGKTCSVVLHKTHQINEGDIYYMPADIYHASHVAANTFTCTFLFAFNRGKPKSTILGPIDGLNEYSYENRLVDKGTVDNILKKLLPKR